ncbi:MAG: response regulator, partial [Planctomycetes bacterium]|nr:response regulator [Planctomycetota bacterium]
ATIETAEAAVEAGAWKIIPKPLDFSRLLELVEEAVGQPLVMVVDDDPELCATLWDLLRAQGYRVCIAHSEQEAAERLKDRTFKVVLIDMKLSQGDGVRVFRLLREANPEARAILISGYRTELEEVITQVVSEGADAVCYKPFDVPSLLETLGRLAG